MMGTSMLAWTIIPAETQTRGIGAVIAQDLGLGASWVIGDSFLKSHYAIYELGNIRLGFAAPKVL